MKNKKYTLALLMLLNGAASAQVVVAFASAQMMAYAPRPPKIDNIATINTQGIPPKGTNPASVGLASTAQFDIVYADASLERDIPNLTDGSTQTALATTKAVRTAQPGEWISTRYKVVHKGSGPQALFVNLIKDADQLDGQTAPVDVKYYPDSADTNHDGRLSEQEMAVARPIANYDIILYSPAYIKYHPTNNSGETITSQKYFFQMFRVPENAKAGEIYGASPEGVGELVTFTGQRITGMGEDQKTVYNRTNYAYTVPQTPALNADLQYIKVNVKLPLSGNVVFGKFVKTNNGDYPAGHHWAVSDGNGGNNMVTERPKDGVFITNPEGFNGLPGKQTNTSYQAGSRYEYLVIGKNGFNTSITNFKIDDTLDNNLSLQKATCIQNNTEKAAVVNENTLTCTFEKMLPGEEVKLKIEVVVGK